MATHPVFVRDYLPNLVPVPYFTAHGALYVRQDSPEALKLDTWREPVVD